MFGIRSTRDNTMRQHQDAAPAAIVQPAAIAWAPVLAIGCVILAAFSVAVMIVLALIPLYLPTKSVDVNNQPVTPATGNTNGPNTFSAVYPIRWVDGAPNGVRRPILMINNQYPGPQITVQRGDTVNITFINESDEEITVHWHGMLQRQTNHMDGVPGVTQCGIRVGESFVYTFSTGTQYGTFWYHSHNGVQLGDGLQGALIVQNPNDPWRSQYTDEDVLLMTEWYHTAGYLLLREFVRSFTTDPIPETGLVNGIGQFNCNPTTTCSYYRTFIRPGTTKRLRFINTSLYTKITVTIDQHTMRVIEADGITLTGTRTTRSLRFNPAQRYSVLVTALTNPAPSYWIRVTLHGYVRDVGLYTLAIQPNISAILQYVTNDNTNVSVIVPALNTFNNDDALIAQSFYDGEIYADETGLFPMPNVNNQEFPTGAPVTTVVLNLTAEPDPDAGGRTSLFFNGATFVHPTTQTMLGSLLVNNLTALYGPLAVRIERGNIIDMVINNIDFLPHPMHLHGHEKWLLAAGSYNDGYFGNATRGNIVYDTGNPIVRDVITLNPFTYIVMRFIADNPGIWIVHCHNDWHLNLGMAIVFVESPDELRNYYLNRTSTISIPTSCAVR